MVLWFAQSEPPIDSHNARASEFSPANLFTIRTYKKCVYNPFSICTYTSFSKQMAYNPFTLRTYTSFSK